MFSCFFFFRCSLQSLYFSKCYIFSLPENTYIPTLYYDFTVLASLIFIFIQYYKYQKKKPSFLKNLIKFKAPLGIRITLRITYIHITMHRVKSFYYNIITGHCDIGTGFVKNHFTALIETIAVLIPKRDLHDLIFVVFCFRISSNSNDNRSFLP